MWFKNARLYSVTLSDEHKAIFNNEELLEKTIASKSFRPCQDLELESIGFSPVFGKHSGAYTYTYGKNHFFNLTEESKLLPASVVKTQVEIDVEEKEAELGREITKRELQVIKTAATNNLLPRAFSIRRDLLIWVNSEYGYVAVAASSAKRCEKAIAMVREAFSGTFPAKSFSPRCVVDDRMTTWISKDELPQIFALGADAVLKSSDDDGGTVRVSGEDLKSAEVMNHIEAGKVITDIQLIYEDTISFILGSDLSLKRIKPEDQYLEKNLPEKSEDAIADMQAHLILQCDVFTNLINRLVEIFDCE